MYDAGRGEMEGWFYFDQPTKVDEVRVQMVPVHSKEPIASAALKIGAEWKNVSEPPIRQSNLNTRPSGYPWGNASRYHKLKSILHIELQKAASIWPL